MKNEPAASGSPLKITMASLRLTGDQAQRLLRIHRAKALECYEYWDGRLRDLGLVEIGPIPLKLRTEKEKWMESAWAKARGMVMAVTDGMPSASKLKEIDGLLRQIGQVNYQIGKRYSTLTEAGKRLADTGRTVLLPRDISIAKSE